MSTFLSFQVTIEMEPKVYVKKGKVNFLFFYCTCYQKKQKEFGKRRADPSGTKPSPKHNKALFATMLKLLDDAESPSVDATAAVLFRGTDP